MKDCVCLIPAYNEEANIGKVIQLLKKYPVDIVVVDDGSTDKTSEVVKRNKAILLQHRKNGGKGEAIRTGIRFALKHKSKYIVLVDADLQYHPKDAIKLLKPLIEDKADFSSGFRNFKEVPYANRAGNFIWRILFNFFFGTNYYDTNCGLIAFNQKAAKSLLGNIYGGYVIDNAIKIILRKENLRGVQVQVRVRYGKRKISKFARMFFGNLFFIVKEGINYL